jgi:hypothetical protein
LMVCIFSTNALICFHHAVHIYLRRHHFLDLRRTMPSSLTRNRAVCARLPLQCETQPKVLHKL